jgi:hypothetical protein
MNCQRRYEKLCSQIRPEFTFPDISIKANIFSVTYYAIYVRNIPVDIRQVFVSELYVNEVNIHYQNPKNLRSTNDVCNITSHFVT